MESNKIQDSQLSSNTFSSGWLPEYGRLNNNGAWCSKNNDETSEYFQIDLLRVRHVSAIATQGVYWNYLSYYVKTYTIKHSYDGMDWLTYKDSDGDSDRVCTPPHVFRYGFSHSQSCWCTMLGNVIFFPLFFSVIHWKFRCQQCETEQL